MEPTNGQPQNPQPPQQPQPAPQPQMPPPQPEPQMPPAAPAPGAMPPQAPLTPGGYDQSMAPAAPVKKRFGLKSANTMWLFAGVFALIGAVSTLLIFAQSTRTEYFWATETYNATYYDDQVHTKAKDCQDYHLVCHDNGTLVFTGGIDTNWQSDPKKNSPEKKLKGPTWYGPYVYSQGPTYTAYSGVTGQQETCFYVKDVSANGVTARMTIQVQNEKNGNQKAVLLKTRVGSLDSEFKKDFKPVCLDYSNPYDTYSQQYRLYVHTGAVQIQYVDHKTQCYKNDLGPYPYAYANPNPYPYDNTVCGQYQKAKTGQYHGNTVSCPANISKSTKHCLSASDLKKANTSSLENAVTNPSDVISE